MADLITASGVGMGVRLSWFFLPRTLHPVKIWYFRIPIIVLFVAGAVCLLLPNWNQNLGTPQYYTIVVLVLVLGIAVSLGIAWCLAAFIERARAEKAEQFAKQAEENAQKAKGSPGRPRVARATPLPSRVCVVVPDSSDDPENASHEFYEDGRVQENGFRAAARRHIQQTGNHDLVIWCGMQRQMTGPEIMERMKLRYLMGARFFVMTMTGKIEAVKPQFVEWRAECIQRKEPAPVLVATVSSAPGVADIAGGIVRRYIRSEEESDELAKYLRSKCGTTVGASFYIAGDAQHPSPFGRQAADAFQKPFPIVRGRTLRSEVSAVTANDKVAAWLKEWRTWPKEDQDRTGVFVAGYGSMLPETVSALIKCGFPGPIACTSTLTQSRWQPECEDDGRIFTVLPLLADGESVPLGKDRNVVYFFAKSTLDRVLEMMRQDSGDTGKFLERWRNQDFPSAGDDHQLSEEVDAKTGDIRIAVTVVDHNQWRHRDRE